MFQSKKNFEFVTAFDKNKFCSLRILLAGDLYSAANDPAAANDPRPQLIPNLDRK